MTLSVRRLGIPGTSTRANPETSARAVHSSTDPPIPLPITTLQDVGRVGIPGTHTRARNRGSKRKTPSRTTPTRESSSLQSTWTLWYQEPDRTKSWENIMNGDQLFQSREFWSLYNHIKSPADDIKVGSDYSFFKKDIRPMREDDSNKRRGWWMCHGRSVRSWTSTG
nr:eukaryotic translation initiation factor 4E1-like [Aedes albopictus]